MKTYDTKGFPGAIKLIALIVGGLWLAPGVQAATTAEQDLAERMRALEAELSAVKAQVQAAQAQAAEAQVRAAEAGKSASAGNVVSIQERGGRLQLATADGNFTFRLGGRLLLDSSWYDATRHRWAAAPSSALPGWRPSAPCTKTGRTSSSTTSPPVARAASRTPISAITVSSQQGNNLRYI